MNEMARTSTHNGKQLDESVVATLRSVGWEVVKNFKVVARGADGKGIVPDVLAKKGEKLMVIENKVNGPDVGTLHEKWPYALIKVSAAAAAMGGQAVMVIEDRSKKLTSFIDAVVRPMADKLSVVVFTKEQFECLNQR